MKKEWLIIDHTDGQYEINLTNVRYIIVNTTQSTVRFKFEKDHGLLIGVEGSHTKIQLSNQKFKELLKELPVI